MLGLPQADTTPPPRDLPWRVVQMLAIISMIYAWLMVRTFAFKAPHFMDLLSNNGQESLAGLYSRSLAALAIPLFISAGACLRRKNWARLLLLLCAATLLVGSALWIGISIFTVYKWLIRASQPVRGPFWIACSALDQFISVAICPAMILVMLRWPELQGCFRGARIPEGFELIPLARSAPSSPAVPIAEMPSDLPARLVKFLAIFGLVISGFGLFYSFVYTVWPTIQYDTFGAEFLQQPRRFVPITLSVALLVGSWQCLLRKPVGVYVMLAWSAAWPLWHIFWTAMNPRLVLPRFLDITNLAPRLIFAVVVFLILMRREMRNTFGVRESGFEPIVKDHA